MATTFQVLKKSGNAPVFVRIQSTSPKINIALSTGLKVNAEEWHKAVGKGGSVIKKENHKRKYPQLWQFLDSIRETIDARLASGNGITSEEAREIVLRITHAEEIARQERERAEETKRREDEERKRLEELRGTSLVAYWEKFVGRKEESLRKARAAGGKIDGCSERTITNYRQGLNRLFDYIEKRGVSVNWEDLKEKDFFIDYIDFLRTRENGRYRESAYNDNTIAKRLGEFRTIAKAARADKITDVIPVECDETKISKYTPGNIYLTRDELKRFAEVDLSGLPPKYEAARDIFLVGCYTGQRISDYNHIAPKDIIEDGNDTKIRFVQRKTGETIFVPANKILREILKKYSNNLPSICDQLLNRHIKEIARLAGIDDNVEIESTRGGMTKKSTYKKYELVTSHTARRTAATLMYLEGVPPQDIIRATGHKDFKMLEKYIKSSAKDNAEKLMQYDFFK